MVDKVTFAFTEVNPELADGNSETQHYIRLTLGFTEFNQVD